MSTFKPSPLQLAIYNFIKHGKGSAIVAAVAGSGKTTTIVNALKFILSTSKVIFLAFNKSIAMELSAKVPAFVQCKTLNAAGMSAFRNMVSTGGRAFFKIDTDKTKNIINFMGIGHDIPEIAKLVALGKSYGVAPRGMRGAKGITEDTDQFWIDLMDHYDMDIPDYRKEAIIDHVCNVLRAGLQDLKVIDFDDQLYMPVILGARFDRYDWVFVDEAQDVSPVQRAMLGKMLNESGRLVAVGDPCQPTGTLVDVVLKRGDRWNKPVIKQIPIERLKVGDTVISLGQKDRQWNRNKTIKGITSRPYEGRLIVIKAGKNKSKYTPNHHCFVSFAPHKDKWCVYLMRSGNKYRVGKAKMDYGKVGSGLVARYSAERADAAWILTLHDTDAEALLYEQVVSANYGIPQLMFKAANNSTKLTQAMLARTWAEIKQNTTRGELCLESYGRSPKYPLISGNRDWSKSLKRPMVTQACNIMNDCLVLPYSHGNKPISSRSNNQRSVKRSDWIPAKISWENNFDGMVWSMTIEGDHTYVGDGILTHNCQAIYGFRGADSESLGNIAKEFNAVTLPLSISYRCPRSVVEYAQKVVSHIEASPTAIEGSVETWGDFDGSEFTSKDMVICRNTAPLVKVAYGLIGRHIPAKVIGRDIGTNLVKLIDRLKPKGIDGDNGLINKLDIWREKETKKALEKDKESLVQSIDDKYETLIAFINGAKADTVPKIKEAINNMFGGKQENAIPLCTVHKSKGLEAKRVFVLDDHLMPSKYARKPWQQDQENNLRYVAYTRAQEDLIFIDSESLVDNKAKELNNMTEQQELIV